MLKRNELADPNSCLNKAKDDELVFVLLGRDEATANAIMEWIKARILLRLNHPLDGQIASAYVAADTAMEQCKLPKEHWQKK